MIRNSNVGSLLRFGRRWLAFAALCLAGIAELILSEPLPQAAPTLLSLAAACGVVCLASMAIALARAQPVMREVNVWKSAVGGCCVLCGPAIALFVRPHDLMGSDLLLAGCLVPVIVAVATATQNSSGGLAAGALWPGLAAVGGLLLLVTQPRVHSVQGWLVLLLLPVLTGVGASFLESTGASAGGLQAAYATMVGCLAFGFAAFVNRTIDASFSWLAFMFSVILISGTISAVERVGATRYSAYFVILPLAVLLYGFVIFRPAVTMRAGIGLVLLGWSVVALLRNRQGDPTETNFVLSK